MQTKVVKDTIILFYPKVDLANKISNLPFSLLYLERSIRHLDLKIILIDERLTENYFEIVKENIEHCLLVGVSAMFGNQMVSGEKFSKFVKSISKKTIVWGGWYPTVLPKLVLNLEFVDYVIIGQGEIPFRELVDAIYNNNDPSNIMGLAYKTENELIINKSPILQEDDFFPSVDYSLININQIIELNGKPSPGNRSINYIATKGCPHDCYFCCLADTWGKRFFPGSVTRIINDIIYFKNTGSIDKISFDDDNFFGSKKFVIDLCKQILDRKISFLWEANAHIKSFLNQYTNEDLEIIYNAGCRKIRFGAESGDENVLIKINKKHTIKDCVKLVKMLKKQSIIPVFFVMAAFPWNPNKDFRLSLKMLGKLKRLNYQFEAVVFFFVPFPQTKLFKLTKQYEFNHFSKHESIISFISSEYYPPWWKANYRKQLNVFFNFYLKFINLRSLVKVNNLKEKNISIIFYLAFFPLIFLRVQLGFYKFPIEAFLFNFFSRFLLTENNNKNNTNYNKIMGTSFQSTKTGAKD